MGAPKLTAAQRRAMRAIDSGTPLPLKLESLEMVARLGEADLITAERTPGGGAFTRWVVTPAGRAALDGAK